MLAKLDLLVNIDKYALLSTDVYCSHVCLLFGMQRSSTPQTATSGDHARKAYATSVCRHAQICVTEKFSH